MNKVVLLTDRPEERETLISYLKILFPECEIEARPKQAAKLQRLSFASEPFRPSDGYKLRQAFEKDNEGLQ